MGVIELNDAEFTIRAHLIFYGNAATPLLANQMAEEIDTLWNEPAASVNYRGKKYQVRFRTTASHSPDLSAMEVISNTDPHLNYFRIEEFVHGNISFVDGLGCNTGYFKLENLYPGSTTAAHEYGHTLGLEHPVHLDLRGKGVPGIMYPRGTLVDPQFQYDPSKPAGVTGGTMHPMHRRVKQEDVELLNIPELFFRENLKYIGRFTSIYHEDHAGLPEDVFRIPPVQG